MADDRDRLIERTREALAAKNEDERTKDEERQGSAPDRTWDDADARAKEAAERKKAADEQSQ